MGLISRMLTVTCLLAISMHAAAAEQAMRSITFDSPLAAIKPAEKRLLDRGVGPLIVDAKDEAPITTTVDIGTPYHLWLSDDHYGKGSRSLGMSIDRESRPDGASQKSKIEVNVLRHDERGVSEALGQNFMLTDHSDGYLGFALKLDESYDVPSRWVLHFQVFQCCTSARLQPPLAMVAMPGPYDSSDGIRFFFIKRTDQYANNDLTYLNGKQLPLLNGKSLFTLKKGLWHKFAIYLKPDPETGAPRDGRNKNGEIGVWLDDQKILSDKGPWGYSDRFMDGPVSHYALKLGIYRAAQESTQKIYLDSIKWGRSLSAVSPNGE